METSPVAQRLSKRFVAGETLEQALSVARKLHAEGITVTLDHLGESVTSLAEAGEARDVYLRTLEAIHAEPGSGGGNVSLKLTQFGLDLSYDECLANVEQLVRRAAELGASCASTWNPASIPIARLPWSALCSSATERSAW